MAAAADFGTLAISTSCFRSHCSLHHSSILPYIYSPPTFFRILSSSSLLPFYSVSISLFVVPFLVLLSLLPRLLPACFRSRSWFAVASVIFRSDRRRRISIRTRRKVFPADIRIFSSRLPVRQPSRRSFLPRFRARLSQQIRRQFRTLRRTGSSRDPRLSTERNGKYFLRRSRRRSWRWRERLAGRRRLAC